MSRTVQKGDTILIHYRGALDDGAEFDSSKGRAPLEFTVGSGQVIPGFDAGVLGLEVGGTKTIRIPCAEAYGPREEEMRLTIPRAEMPPHLNPEPGMMLRVQTPQGEAQMAVVKVDEQCVIIDGNHPLAGQDLTFELELVEILGA
jgi:peptidylprolyl isomerase